MPDFELIHCFPSSVGGRWEGYVGEITYSFVAAIVMVNLILTVYVIVAYLEEDGDAAESGIKIKNQ